jgi:hypothetical protein
VNRITDHARYLMAAALLDLRAAKFKVALLFRAVSTEAVGELLADFVASDIAIVRDVEATLDAARLMVRPTTLILPVDARPIVSMALIANDVVFAVFDTVPFLPFVPNGLPLVVSWPPEGLRL